MNKKLLIGMLAFGTMFNVQGQIAATDTIVCAGTSVTLTAPSGNTLPTTLASGNGHRGNMFDVVALNDIIINSFDAHPAGDTDIEIYYKVGTYVGSETNAAAWTLIGSASVIAQPTGTATVVPIAVNQTILTGQTYAFYITSTNLSINLNYTDGTTVGNTFASDANLDFKEGIGLEYPYGGSFSPRVWNGNINYSLVSSVINWSTGATGPSITVTPTDSTEYFVAVDSPTYTDSITIAVNPIYNITGTPVNACDSALFNGVWYNSSQIVLDSLVTTVTGCDSIISTAISITDVSVTSNDPTLTANQSGVSYQWLDCSNSFAQIVGATSQTFTPITNGDYAVEITDNGCTDTSACYAIATVGLDENSLFNVSIYPNPTNGEVNVNLGNLSDVTVMVYTMNGQLVFQEQNINDSNFKFELNEVKGVYIIEVSVEGNKRQFKLVMD